MKKLFIALLLLSITMLPSCKKDTKSYTVGIDVQSIFYNDSLQVMLDNVQLINKRLTTEAVLGVCTDGRIISTQAEGSHQIKVVLNDSLIQTDTFSLTHDLYIGIHRDPTTNVLSFLYSNQKFMYD